MLYRIKRFSIQEENMKTQREIMRNQRQKEKFQEEGKKQRIRYQQSIQRQENQKIMTTSRNQARLKISQNSKVRTPGFRTFKKLTSTVKPIAMKKIGRIK